MIRRKARRQVLSSLFVGFCGLSVLVALVPLALILFFVISQGIRALNLDFFTHHSANFNPAAAIAESSCFRAFAPMPCSPATSARRFFASCSSELIRASARARRAGAASFGNAVTGGP